MTPYDYVVVGAGAAGCVLANRLSTDPAVRVLLVEAGGRGRHPILAVPRAFFFTLRSARWTYRYPAGAGETWLRGRGLGGSTLVNGMMYVRGADADADALESAGNPGWGRSTFRRAYRELEEVLTVSVSEERDEVTSALLESAATRGLRQVADFNAADVSDDERIAFTPATIQRGRRVSAASAFLRPVRRRPNLTVLTRATVERVLLQDGRAVGVQVRRGRRVHEYRARGEVILAAGSIETPALLERSGVGRRDVLRAAGVESVVSSPKVGEGLVEHRAVSMQVRLDGRRGPTESLNTPWRQVLAGARYLVTRSGPVATSGYDVVSAFRSSPTVLRPDVQGVWVPMAIDHTAAHMRLARYSGLLFTGYALRPTTSGSVHIADRDAAVPPVISPAFLEDDVERAVTGSILAHARRVVATPPLAHLVAGEVFPGAEVASPEEVVAYARDHGGGVYHAVGSCAMGPAADDVVDADLRVRGVDGLRVADASVLPFQMSGNSAAPVMALAWIAADRIVASRRAP